MKVKKQQIRRLASAFRQGHAADQWQSVSARIQNHFISADMVKKGFVVGCYISIHEKREVETSHIINNLSDVGAHVAFPRIVNDLGLMEMVICEPTSKFPVNRWGIPEPPQECPAIDPKTLDIILVPMLAADFHGGRLGFGKGFYDRYLAGSNALKVGLCNFDNVFEKLPTDKHDQPMDVILTEYGKIRMFQGNHL